MLLAIDIGNTNTVIGLFDGERLIDHFRAASVHSLTIDECGFFVSGLLDRSKFSPDKVTQVVIASVVPRLTPVYEGMARKYFEQEPLTVSSRLNLPIKIGYLDPTAVGADRIANAVAGFVRFGGPLIIVDYGTATAFDVITAEGVYLGGVIAPGPETSGGELARRAARLFEVRIEKPSRVIGRTTAESIKSGLFYGTVGQVDLIIQLIIEELMAPARVIATGGLATDFAAESKFIEATYPTLTLDGLKIIAGYSVQ